MQGIILMKWESLFALIKCFKGTRFFASACCMTFKQISTHFFANCKKYNLRQMRSHLKCKYSCIRVDYHWHSQNGTIRKILQCKSKGALKFVFILKILHQVLTSIFAQGDRQSQLFRRSLKRTDCLFSWCEP